MAVMPPAAGLTDPRFPDARMTAAPRAELDQVFRDLRRLQTKLRLLHLVEGAGRFLLVAGAYLAAALTADLAIDMPSWTRVLLLAGFAGVGGYAGWRWLFRPATRQYPPSELAALVEREHPELQERLLSTIEFCESPDSGSGSPILRALLAEETCARIRAVPVESAASPVGAQRYGIVAAAVLVAAVLPLIASPHVYGLLLQRLFRPTADLASPSNLYFEIDEPDRVVARGSDVEIVVRPRWHRGTGPFPSSAAIEWKDDEGIRDSRALAATEEGRLAATLPGVERGFEYRVRAGRVKSETYRIVVVDRPAVVEAVLEARPPAYTGRPARSFDGLVGDVELFERSRVEFRARFNKPVQSARWVWGESSDGAQRPGVGNAAEDAEKRIELALADDRLSATWSGEIGRGGLFRIELEDEHRLKNIEPRRRIVLVKDQPPRLVVDAPQSQEVQPSDKVRFPVVATDDVGLGALELHLEGVAGGAIVEPWPGKLAAELAGEFQVDLAALGLAPGAVLAWRIRAADERPEPGPQEVWSETRTLVVKSQAPPQLEQALAAEQGQLQGTLENLQAALQRRIDELSELQTAADQAARRSREFARRGDLAAEVEEQKKLQEQFAAAADELARHPIMSPIAEAAAEIADQALPNAARRVEEAREKPVLELSQELLRARDELQAAQRKLQQAVEQFERLAETERNLLELQRIEDEAERLAREAEELDRQIAETEQNADRLGPEQLDEARNDEAARRAELERRHAELLQQLERLLAENPELMRAVQQQRQEEIAGIAERLRELAEPQSRLAEQQAARAAEAARRAAPLARTQEELNREIERLERDVAAIEQQAAGPLDPRTPPEIDAALRQGDLPAAAREQEERARQLDRLAQNLTENPPLPEVPREALAELARRQEQLARDLDELKKPGEPAAGENAAERAAAREQQQRDLAAQQAALTQAAARQPLPAEQRDAQNAAVDAMTDVTEELRKNELEQAAAQAHRAAEQLEQLAKTAPETAPSDQERADRAASRQETLAKAAELARQLAREQAELARQTQETQQNRTEAQRGAAEPPPAGGADPAVEKLEQEQRGLAERAEELPRDVAPLSRADAQRHLERAADALQQADLERARREQAQAQQALEQIGRQAEQLAQRQDERPSTPETAETASRLAEAQRELARQTQTQAQPDAGMPPGRDTANAEPQPAGEPRRPAEGESPAGERREGTPPQPSTAQQQAQLAERAQRLEQALARERGADDESTRAARESARQAREAARDAQSGQNERAAQSGERAAESLEELQRELESRERQEANPPGGEGTEENAPPPRAEQAGELARQQRALAQQLAEQAQRQSPEQQTAEAQRDVARQAEQLARELDQALQQAARGPAPLDQPAQPDAQHAREQSQRAAQHSDSAAEQSERGNAARAAPAAQQAAEALRAAADAAQRGMPQNSPPSAVPTSAAEQIRRAAEQLQQAGEELAQARPAGESGTRPANLPGGEPGRPAAQPGMEPGQSGEPGMPSGQPGAQPGQPGREPGQPGRQPGGQPSQPGREPGQPGSEPGQPGTQGGQPGSPNGEPPSALNRAAARLREAADALARASSQVQGRPSEQGDPAGDPQGSPGGTGVDSGDARDDGEVDLSALSKEVQKVTGRRWGQLPGHLKTEILQSARKKPNSEYGRLVKAYFEEIAKAPAGRPAK